MFATREKASVCGKPLVIILSIMIMNNNHDNDNDYHDKHDNYL